MDESNIAIRLSGVRKQYRLGEIGGKTLQAELESWWAKRRGLEDPNRRLGADPSKIGQPFWALDGVDLTVTRGERVGIIGANGAGKSTLLKLLCRITAPTEGEIDLWGRVSSMLEVGTGFHREMTGRENIYMNGAILGMSRAEINARMDDIIAFSEIAEFIDTPVKRYSSGMFVKLAFSVAAHLTSEIMIMDEVLSVGDMAFQQKCLDRMRRAAEDEGRTVLYVSHNMATIRRLCERCIVMERGKIVFDGDTERAIALYMERSLGDNAVDIDLDAAERGRELNGRLRMLRFRLTDKDTPVYQRGEPLRGTLTVRASEPVKGARLRLTLRSDSDVGLGTAWSKPFDLDAGETDLPVTLPLDGVEKGVFYASIGLYADALAQQTALDHVTRAFRIEVAGSPRWSTSAYGYFGLHEIGIG